MYGPVDLLVNNAGVMLLGNVLHQDPQEWQTMLDTNVMGVLNGMQLVLPDMVARKSGTVINISSLAGKKTFVNHAAYVASKFGVHGLSETIREEVSGNNVRVTIVAPGAAETDLLTHVTDDGALKDYEAWKQTMGGCHWILSTSLKRSGSFTTCRKMLMCVKLTLPLLVKIVSLLTFTVESHIIYLEFN